MRAGAATADITPEPGLTMGGYGRRTGVARGVADPLLVRALVLSDGSTDVALAVCDLLGVGTDLVGATRRRVTAATGIPGDHVLVAATHTHSGPAGIRAADAPAYVETAAARAAEAVAAAHRALEPVQLKVGVTELTTVGRNRRDPDGPVEERLRVLVADPGRDRPPVATLVNYACHSTVREHDNLDYSADWPGAMSRLVEHAVGGTAIYLQGAAGDVNPVWSGHDHHEVERVGGVVGAAAARLVHEMRPLGTGQWCINLSWSEDVAVPATGRLLGDGPLAVARRILEVERRVRAGPDEIDAELEDLQRRIDATTREDAGPAAERLRHRRTLRARVNELATARLFAPTPAPAQGPTEQPGRRLQPVEVQAIRIADDCVVVSLPGEFFVATGRDIAARSGVEHTFIAGYANGSVGYVPPAPEYVAAGYEVGMTQFPAGAAEVVADAAVDLVRSLYREQAS